MGHIVLASRRGFRRVLHEGLGLQVHRVMSLEFGVCVCVYIYIYMYICPCYKAENLSCCPGHRSLSCLLHLRV